MGSNSPSFSLFSPFLHTNRHINVYDSESQPSLSLSIDPFNDKRPSLHSPKSRDPSQGPPSFLLARERRPINLLTDLFTYPVHAIATQVADPRRRLHAIDDQNGLRGRVNRGSHQLQVRSIWLGPFLFHPFSHLLKSTQQQPSVLPDAHSSETFSFKCHRKEASLPQSNPPKPSQVFAVNDISFHKGYGTFASGGNDGLVHIWDAQARSRLKSTPSLPSPLKKDCMKQRNESHDISLLPLPPLKAINPTTSLPPNATPTPIVATAFNGNHSILAYAQSYDWSRGHIGATPDQVVKVWLHVVKDEEVRGKNAR